MTALVLFILAVIGLTNIMVNSSIMEPVRGFLKARLPERTYELFECYQCMGTWCGFFCGLLTVICRSDNLLGEFSTILLYGFAGSFIASFTTVLFDIVVIYKDRMATFPWPQEENNETT